MEGEKEGAKMEEEDENTYRKPEGASRLPAEEAAEALRMGSWRLRGHVCSQIEALVAQIESAWRSVFGKDFRLYQLPKDLRFVDSMDKERKYPMSYAEILDPTSEEPGYPRLMLEGRAYQTRVFRKAHLQILLRQDGTEVLHCAMFPRPEFDLPILTIDAVATGGKLTQASADPCPVNSELQLPEFYAKPIKHMQRRFPQGPSRPVPGWAAAISSPLAVHVAPATPEEAGNFIKYAITVMRYHTEVGRIMDPVSGPAAARRRSAICAAHAAYCRHSRGDRETGRLLEAGFGRAWADTWLSTVMFEDVPPERP